MQFLQIHVNLSNGCIRPCPCSVIRIGSTPTTIPIVVDSARFESILCLIGSTCQEIGTVGLKLIIIYLCIDIEHHVLNAVAVILVGPRLVAG